ncbi:galactose mutarotase-like protein [Roridomyces roridus]|uniref:Glucose-6-phosphate 1-epimerase n=1 Tax=Roridomyces roridus TaxID=1738132 RepID=A0AAD7BVJ6_9AGAR|nr:galactose mutarotase-like protein [Roridomyces roridus]
MSSELIVLHHPSGSTVDILPYGATVVSWKTAGQERLFVSKDAIRDGSKPVRGGIPIVFPWFGAASQPQLPQHGFARSSVWSYAPVKDGDVSVTLTLEPTELIQSLYKPSTPPPFHLSLVVTLGEFDLSTELQVRNTSASESFEFQGLFHNYIRAPVDQIRVSPLGYLTYFDKTVLTEDKQPTPRIHDQDEVQVKKFTDSVYENAAKVKEGAQGPQDGWHGKVTWPGGSISVDSANLKDIVVWNPYAELGDMKGEQWRDFVCCEPGHVRGFVKIAPGETWAGSQKLTVGNAQ